MSFTAEGSQVLEPTKDPEIREFIKELSQNSNFTEEEQAKIVAMRIQARTPKNYGFYRVGAIRGIGGGKKLTPPMNPQLHEVGVLILAIFTVLFNAGRTFPASVHTCIIR